MELKDFLGYRLSDAEPYLLHKKIQYTLIELRDCKNTKMGDELRIVKIEEKETVNIYVSYF